MDFKASPGLQEEDKIESESKQLYRRLVSLNGHKRDQSVLFLY